MSAVTTPAEREPLEVWTCATCGRRQMGNSAWHFDQRQPRSGVACWAHLVVVRHFREDDVRPLYDTLSQVSEIQCTCTGYYRCNGCEREAPGLADAALEAFPAPKEWER